MRRTASASLTLVALCAFGGSASAQIDSTPPSVVAFSFTPASVDVTGGPATVSVTMSITDDLSGFGLPPSIGPSVGFRAPTTGGVSASCTFSSGSATNQIWNCTATIPQYVEAGTWLAVVNLSDVLGNSHFFEPSELESLGFLVELEVTSTPDTTAPTVEEFGFAPALADASTGPATVSVTLRIADDLSGFGMPPSIGPSVGFRAPTTPNGVSASCSFGTGSATDQTWNCQATIPQYAEPGVWKAVVNLNDIVGNSHFFEPSELQSLGFPVELQVVSSPDTTAPTVQEFDFSPAAVDISTGAATVNVSLRIADDLSGFGMPPSIGPSVGFRAPTTPNGVSASCSFGTGSATDQTWNCQATIPQYAEPGTWKAVVNLNDIVGNSHFFEPSELQSLGFPVDLQVGGPTLSIADVSVVEGRAGAQVVDFTVSLSSPSNKIVTVNYATASGSAQDGTDFRGWLGTLRFPPGMTSRKVSVIVWGDRLVEPDETFFVNLSGAVNAGIQDAQAVGTILNDDLGAARDR